MKQRQLINNRVYMAVDCWTLCLCYCIKGGLGGKIIVYTMISGLSLLLYTDEEKSLAAVKVKGQLVHNYTTEL